MKDAHLHEHIPAVAAIVGDDHVSDSPSTLAIHADLGVFAGGLAPAVVARPGSGREVRDLVVWANRTRTPLVPVSSGAPHRHGASSPSVPGALLVDLTRLDRVLRIDRRNRMVVIEPGVTYPRLQAALAEYGMRVATPLQPRSRKSVVASLLEREPTVIPRHNHALPEPLRDCGVVWGNGVTMFTGEAGAGPPSLDEQWRSGLIQAEAKGPGQTDFYRLLTGAQGTMGIVTWASVRCDLVPAVHEYRHATADRYEELAPLMSELCLQRLGDEIMVFNQRRLADVLGVAAPAGWTFVAGFAGCARQAERRMRVHIDDAAAVARTCGISMGEGLPGVPSGPSDPLAEGPSDGRPTPSCAEVIFLSPTCQVPRLLTVMSGLAERHGFASSEVGVYVQPQHQGVTYHVEFTVPYEDADDDARARSRRLVAAAGSELAAAGAYFSRPYGAWAGPVYNRDAAARDALRKVKAVFDPAGVLNPGKLCFGAPAAPARAGSEA